MGHFFWPAEVHSRLKLSPHDHLGRFFGDHHDSGVGVAVDDRWHNGGINYAQAFEPNDSAFGIHNAALFVR